MNSRSHEISKELRAVKKAEYERQRRRESTTGLTHWTLRTALCIACLCDWDFTLAVEWLSTRKRRGAEAEDMGEHFRLHDALENVFLNTELTQMTNWVDPGAGFLLDASVKKTAIKWVAERRTKYWVAMCNSEHGQAVRSELVLRRYNELLAEVNVVPDLLPLPCIATFRGRNWMRRWRRTHRGAIGRIRLQEEYSLEEIRDTASSVIPPDPNSGTKNGTKKWYLKKDLFCSLFGRTLEPELVPKVGTIFGTQKWGHVSTHKEKQIDDGRWYPKTGTRNGT